LEEPGLTLERVVELYHEYEKDLGRVRAELSQIYLEKKSPRDLFLVKVGDGLLPYLPDRLLRVLRGFDRRVRSNSPTLRPSFDDVEAEVTYLLIRNARPQTIVEISPSGGWSTLWILSALRDNGTGRLFSYDLVDDATRNIPEELRAQRWTFVRGDVRRALSTLPHPIDYLFIDSDHSSEFADWYLENVLPLLAPNGIVSVDDVLRAPHDRPREFGEGRRLLQWLNTNQLAYLSFSPYASSANYNQAMRVKTELGLDRQIHTSIVNPCVFFSCRGISGARVSVGDLPALTALGPNA
jgi:predicted O-methyltransferase YrrM